MKLNTLITGEHHLVACSCPFSAELDSASSLHCPMWPWPATWLSQSSCSIFQPMNPKMRIQLLLALEMIERDIPARRGAHHSECWLSGVRFTRTQEAQVGIHWAAFPFWISGGWPQLVRKKFRNSWTPQAASAVPSSCNKVCKKSLPCGVFFSILSNSLLEQFSHHCSLPYHGPMQERKETLRTNGVSSSLSWLCRKCTPPKKTGVWRSNPSGYCWGAL